MARMELYLFIAQHFQSLQGRELCEDLFMLCLDNRWQRASNVQETE